MSVHVSIRCDECGRIAGRPFFSQRNEEMVRREATASGWIVPDDGDDICPFCVAILKVRDFRFDEPKRLK